jgi:starvation-inducible DNA-binding protein
VSPKHDKRDATYNQLQAGTKQARPIQHQHAPEIQPYGKIAKLPIALDEKVCGASAENLNQLLADTMTLRDMYKKHHWQVAGHTFYQLHLLFDKHHGEQDELVDQIAERIQLLGGISLAMAADVAETTMIPRPPRGREEAPVQISRLLEAHEMILKEARTMARQASEEGDDGTNDLLVSDVIRTNELQVWFLAEHLVDVPLVRADQKTTVAAGG